MSAATKLLDRLPRVKQLRPNEFISGCPAHGSRQGRPVHITVLDDGRCLLNPFCGCPTEDVLAAIGLEFSDLYPKRLPGIGYGPARSSVSARTLLDLLDHEILVALLIMNDVSMQGGIPTEEQITRLARCSSRIGAARDLVAPARFSRAA